MNFAQAFTQFDKDQVQRWLDWVEELGGMGAHKLFLMPAKCQVADFITTIPFTVINDWMGLKSDWSDSNSSVRDAAGPNSMMRMFAYYFADKKIGPWTFIEPDCIPLWSGWHDAWEAEYRRAGKPFMGAVVNVPNVEQHSTGNMVFPQNAGDLYINLMVPKHASIDGRSVELAFDIAGANDVLPALHNTPLIQHVFRGEKFERAEDLDRISPAAALFHTDKDGGLIKLLRARKSGSVDATTSVHVEDERVHVQHPPSPAPKKDWRVCAYVRWCVDPDALAEQKRIIQLWRRAWTNRGFEPMMLTEANARKHPRFEELNRAFESMPTINPKEYEMACWLRWIAMAQVGGGLMTDYDVLPFDDFPIETVPGEFPLLLAQRVPCVVIGTKEQYEAALNAFANCIPTIEDGQPHLSDMHAVQKVGFHWLDYCREYGKKDWKSAAMVHFNHYSCNPRSRSECMEGAAKERLKPDVIEDLPVPVKAASTEVPQNESTTVVGTMRYHIGILKELIGESIPRKNTFKNELRDSGLIGAAKKKKRRGLAQQLDEMVKAASPRRGRPPKVKA